MTIKVLVKYFNSNTAALDWLADNKIKINNFKIFMGGKKVKVTYIL